MSDQVDIESTIEIKVAPEDGAALGTSLAELVAGGKVEADKAIAIAKEICDALIARKVPHGSLNPDVVVLCSEAAPYDVLIDDFRGGWLTDNSKFTAPEMRKEHASISEAADVYSIGAMLNHMIEGSTCPSPVFEIIRNATQQNAKARYKSPAEMRDALERYELFGSVAPPPQATARRAGPGFAIVMAFLLTLFGGIGWWAHTLQPPPQPTYISTVPSPSGQIIDVQNESTPHEYKALSPQELAILGKYDFAFLLDQSGSMAAADCYSPTDTTYTSPYSRWSWGCRELESFAKLGHAAVPNGFTVITFDDTGTEYDNRNDKDLAEIYQQSGPRGGTSYSVPFKMATSAFGQSTKPLAVVILSDGEPGDREQFLSELASAKAGTKPVRVELLTIGPDRNFGESNVDQANFKEISTNGIAHALAKRLGEEQKKEEK